ncbi:MAG: DUF5666 domain-containing protein [Blastocatellales bacterium]
MTRKTVTQVATLLAVIALAAMPMIARAFNSDDERERNGPSVSGTVSDVAGSTIKILNGLVTVDASAAAIVSEHNNRSLTLADIKVGVVIEVSGNASAGKIAAAVIEVRGPKSDGQIQGAIESVDAANKTITVLGNVIALDTTTVYEGDNNRTISSADLTVGKMVDVEVAVFQNKLVATRVSLDGGESNSESDN